MPSVCAAYNCTNRSNETVGISYFRFPLKNKELTQRWVANMRRDKWQPTRYSYICSTHFEDRYMYTTNNQVRLLARAVPTIFSFPDHLQESKSVLKRAPPKRAIVEKSTSFEVNVSSDEPGQREKHSNHKDHSYCLPSPKKMKLNYAALQERYEKLKKKVKLEKQCVSRMKEQIVNYETLIAGLHRRLTASELLECEVIVTY